MNNRLAKLAYRTYGLLRREPTLRYLKELERTQWLSQDELQQLQWKRLKALLEHAYENVPFYRGRFDEACVLPREMTEPSELACVSPLTKEDIYLNFDELRAHSATQRYDGLATSGSTGTPLTVLRSRLSTAHHRAAMYRGHRWFGVDVAEREVRIWGQSLRSGSKVKEAIKDYLMNRRRLPAYSLDEARVRQFIAVIERFSPSYLFGYASLAYEFARFLLDHGIDGKRFGFRMVKTTSETLHNHFREAIQDAFGCPTVNEYGSTESGIIAFECPEGNLHIPVECVYVEIEPVADAVDANGGGRVLVTDLHNYVMPIIRYDLGDIASFGNGERCGCGRALPILAGIQGRASDFIETPDGRKIHTILFYYAFCGLEAKGCEVNRFQVVRETETDIVVRIVKGERFIEKEFLKALQKIKGQLGPGFSVRHDYVGWMPRSPSGKFRDFVSEWSKPQRT